MELNIKPELEVNVRWMTRRDLQEVLEIEGFCFSAPWDEDEFLERIRRQNSVGMVAETGGCVVGFMIYELRDRGMFLSTLAVHPAQRRQGVGSQMIERMRQKLSDQSRTNISVKIRETNLDALIFFRRLGFKATRVLRAHFHDTGEDAYLMQYDSSDVVLMR